MVFNDSERETEQVDIFCDGEPCKLIVSTKIQNVDEVSRALVLMIPYMLVIALITSIIFSLIIARKFASPLLQLNKKAREIAKFKFDSDIKIQSNDELQELSTSLDIVGNNLSRALDELKDDVKKANQREKDRRMFMSALSHELKTPLTILRGQSECMIENVGLDYGAQNKMVFLSSPESADDGEYFPSEVNMTIALKESVLITA